MSSRNISRRTLFAAAGTGAAITAAPALIGCSTGSAGSVGKKLSPWPTYVAARTPTPDMPGTTAGVRPCYLKYPTNLVTSVSRKPGDGSDVSALVITLTQLQTDGITAIVTGHQPVSSRTGVLKQWKQAGGDASATEFAKEYAAQT